MKQSINSPRNCPPEEYDSGFTSGHARTRPLVVGFLHGGDEEGKHLPEGIATYASTSIVTDLMSPWCRPVTDYVLLQPGYLLQLTTGGDETAYSTIVEPLSQSLGRCWVEARRQFLGC